MDSISLQYKYHSDNWPKIGRLPVKVTTESTKMCTRATIHERYFTHMCNSGLNVYRFPLPLLLIQRTCPLIIFSAKSHSLIHFLVGEYICRYLNTGVLRTSLLPHFYTSIHVLHIGLDLVAVHLQWLNRVNFATIIELSTLFTTAMQKV